MLTALKTCPASASWIGEGKWRGPTFLLYFKLYTILYTQMESESLILYTILWCIYAELSCCYYSSYDLDISKKIHKNSSLKLISYLLLLSFNNVEMIEFCLSSLWPADRPLSTGHRGTEILNLETSSFSRQWDPQIAYKIAHMCVHIHAFLDGVMVCVF